MEGETGNTESINDEVHSWNIQRDQVEGGSGGIRSIIDEAHSSDMQRDQTESEKRFT